MNQNASPRSARPRRESWNARLSRMAGAEFARLHPRQQDALEFNCDPEEFEQAVRRPSLRRRFRLTARGMRGGFPGWREDRRRVATRHRAEVARSGGCFLMRRASILRECRSPAGYGSLPSTLRTRVPA